jgi:hypothetical protein
MLRCDQIHNINAMILVTLVLLKSNLDGSTNIKKVPEAGLLNKN